MTRLLLALLVLLGAPVSAADPPIAQRIVIEKRIEPGALSVFVRIRYDKAFTAYTVAGYCDGVLTQRSTRQLDELSRAPEPPVEWRRMPACHYQVVALLHGAGGAVVARTPALPVTILCFPCED